MISIEWDTFSNMNVLIIVPAYNEEESIVDTIDELNSIVPHRSFLIINDGSRDSTRQICLSRGYTMLDLPANVGLTYGFQAGIKYALRHGYDAVLQFDADGQHEARYIEPMIAQMEQTGDDIVIGSRFISKKKNYSARMIGSRLISLFIRLTAGAKLTDPTSGMRLYNRKMMTIFESMNDFGPEPDSLAYLVRKGANISEIQVQMRDRIAGESYLNLVSSVKYMLRTCISILFVQWFR